MAWGAWFRLTDKKIFDKYPNVMSNGAVEQAKWAMVISMFAEIPYLPAILPTWEWVLAINADGSAVMDVDPIHPDRSTSGINYPLLNELRPYILKGNPPLKYGKIQAEMLTYLHPLLLSIVFMHCKNIILKKEGPSPKLIRKQAKKHGLKLHSYHMLEITPIKKIIEASRTGTTDIKMALHRCRGHFKTYTPDRPLMGRAVGTFFWAEQARGKRQYGEISKDYRVNPTSKADSGAVKTDSSDNR
jgi:hypothetical protein